MSEEDKVNKVGVVKVNGVLIALYDDPTMRDKPKSSKEELRRLGIKIEWYSNAINRLKYNEKDNERRRYYKGIIETLRDRRNVLLSL